MNSKITINVKEVCGDHIYSRADGHLLYDRIKNASSCDTIIVDFGQREIASESFLDEAIVEHYIHPILHDPKKQISLVNVVSPDQKLLSKIYSYRFRLENKEKRKNLKHRAIVKS